MLLSVIIPVYNVEKYVDACLEKVLALRQEMEILLVDDGSTDGSGVLCDEWAKRDGRVRVIHQENAGLSGARNTGIRNSRGEFLAFLDSDDFWNVEEAKRLFSLLNPQYEVVVGLYRNYYDGDELFEKEDCAPFLQNAGEIDRNRFLEILPKDGNGCYLTAWRFIVRRDFLVDNEYFFCEGIYHEDEEWIARWLKRVNSLYLSDCWFYEYRQGRKSSIMGTVKPKHAWDTLTIMEHDKSLLAEAGEDLLYADFLRNRMAWLCLNVLFELPVLSKTEKREALKRLRADYPLFVKGFTGTKGKLIKSFKMVFGLRFTGFALRGLRKLKSIF